MSDTETTPTEGVDHTLTDVKQGSLAYLYGYVPVITFTDEGDGTVEVYHLGNQAFVPSSDLAHTRGARPDFLGPEAEQPGDRIAALEAQVAALVDALGSKGTTVASPAAASVSSGDGGTTDPFGTGNAA